MNTNNNDKPSPASYSFVLAAHFGTHAQILEVLREEACGQVKRWPQYGGDYFTGWRLGRLTRDVRTKLGHAGSKGDLVIFRDGKDMGDPDHRTFWSRSNAIATGVSRRDVEEVGS